MLLNKSRSILFLHALTLILSVFMMSCKDKQTKAEEVAPIETKTTKVIESSAEASKKNILCFGNSLTAGYGLEESEAWPSLLQSKIDSLGLQYNVINAGLSGETTAGGAGRIDWVLNQKVDIFFLELGANDMLRGLAVKQTEEHLKEILYAVNKKYPGTPMIIAGMLAPPNMGKEYEKDFNNIFPNLAQTYDAQLIPFFLEGLVGRPELNLPDGKHPNAEGQKIVLDHVWKALKPLL